MAFHGIKKQQQQTKKLSLWSKRIWRLLRLLTSPVQLRPSPVYPGLHVQTCDPYVLLQVAFTWHLPGYILHSSISVKKNKKRKERKMRKRFYSRVKREKKVENLFAISWFDVALGLDLLVKPVIFFNLFTLVQQVLPKGYAINCSYFATIAQKSRNKQGKKERTKINHPWPHFLAVPNAVVFIWI